MAALVISPVYSTNHCWHKRDHCNKKTCLMFQYYFYCQWSILSSATTHPMWIYCSYNTTYSTLGVHFEFSLLDMLFIEHCKAPGMWCVTWPLLRHLSVVVDNLTISWKERAIYEDTRASQDDVPPFCIAFGCKWAFVPPGKGSVYSGLPISRHTLKLNVGSAV